jgi:hypothetical protein
VLIMTAPPAIVTQGTTAACAKQSGQ